LQQRQEDHLARARGARAGAEDEGRPRGAARRGRRARQPPDKLLVSSAKSVPFK
jgi:hypothetical protein